MPLKPLKQTIIRPSMCGEIYETLLNAILEGELMPGERLAVNELADSFEVSRTPVREALRVLEEKGLVESAANKWTRVSEISRKEPAFIYPIIWTLEGLAISQAMQRITDEDIEAMDNANQKFLQAFDRNRATDIYKADKLFHSIYIERSENPTLIKILQDLKFTYRRIVVIFFNGCASVKDSARQHNEILAAMRERDLPKTQALIQSHWQSSLQRIM